MKILIVEDDSATATFMQMAFDSAGDTVTIASSIEQAMEQVTADPPDVVLTDLTLGRAGDLDADGFSFLTWLKSRPTTAHIGVLAVSGAGSPEVLQAAEDRGFDGFVAKPVDVALLIERAHLLGKAATRRRTSHSCSDPS